MVQRRIVVSTDKGYLEVTTYLGIIRETSCCPFRLSMFREILTRLVKKSVVLEAVHRSSLRSVPFGQQQVEMKSKTET